MIQIEGWFVHCDGEKFDSVRCDNEVTSHDMLPVNEVNIKTIKNHPKLKGWKLTTDSAYCPDCVERRKNRVFFNPDNGIILSKKALKKALATGLYTIK